MDPADHWRRIEELFHAALELEPQLRPPFLQQACGPDMELRNEVESLLDSAGRDTDFLPEAVVEVAHRMSVDDRQKTPPVLAFSRRVATP
jgi:hypothetical protein